MQGKISPSMMCAGITELSQYLDAFKKLGIEYLHVDVMDGVFVPNLQIGTDYIKQLRELSDIPLDVHLMITQPENKIGWFCFKKDEYVSIHYESTVHVQRALSRIRDTGAKPMLAINPATPIYVLEDSLDDIDAVLIMTVNPGYAGQKLIPQTIDKIRRLKLWLNEKGRNDIEIEVDGNVSFENALRMRAAGADIFVAGSSGLFVKGRSLEESASTLRQSII